MKKYLIKLANHLDKKGLHKEADYVDWIMKKSNDSATSEFKDQIGLDVLYFCQQYLSFMSEELKRDGISVNGTWGEYERATDIDNNVFKFKYPNLKENALNLKEQYGIDKNSMGLSEYMFRVAKMQFRKDAVAQGKTIYYEDSKGRTIGATFLMIGDCFGLKIFQDKAKIKEEDKGREIFYVKPNKAS